MMDTIDCIVPAGDLCGEGLIWSEDEQALYWTDINRFLVHRYDTVGKVTKSWLFDQPVVALSLSTDPNRMLVALGSKLIWWWPVTDQRVDHGFCLPDSPRLRLNDGRADPLGNFWIGSMVNNVSSEGENVETVGSEGALYRIAPDGEVTTWMHGIGISNTLCWSPDRRFFYTGDTVANKLYRFAFDAVTGSLSDRTDWFCNHPRGLPDGSAMDAEGHIWNCRFFGKAVIRIGPDGVVDKVIEMPVTNVTTAAFGGPGLQTLYVTSASLLKGDDERLAGSLWAIKVSARGIPQPKVKVL